MNANDADRAVKPLQDVIASITGRFPDVDVATYPPDAAPTAWFFSIFVNPSPATFDALVRPLLDEAYDRVARPSRVETD